MLYYYSQGLFLDNVFVNVDASNIRTRHVAFEAKHNIVMQCLAFLKGAGGDMKKFIFLILRSLVGHAEERKTKYLSQGIELELLRESKALKIANTVFFNEFEGLSVGGLFVSKKQDGLDKSYEQRSLLV